MKPKLQINLEHDDIVKITSVQMPIQDKMYVVTLETQCKYLDSLMPGFAHAIEFSGPMVVLRDGDKVQIMSLSLDGGWTVEYVALKHEYKIIFIADSLVYEGKQIPEKDVDIIEWTEV